MSSWWYGRSHEPQRNTRSPARNSRGSRRSQQPARTGRYQQDQAYVQEETQTQQQAVFMEQTRTTLKVLDTYLDKIVNGGKPEELSALGGSLTALISCMGMSGRDMNEKGMEEGLDAAEGMIREFEQASTVKYESNERAFAVLDNATELLMRTVHNEELPAMPVIDSGMTTTSSAGNGINSFIAGAHQVEKIHEDASDSTNAAKYRASQRAAAEKARELDAYEHREVDIDALTKDIQGRIIHAMDPDEAMRLSRNELRNRLSQEDGVNEDLRHTHVDEDGVPDLGCSGEMTEEENKSMVGDVVTLDSDQTKEYVTMIDTIEKGVRIDGHTQMFGGLWAPGIVIDRETTEEGASIFRVQFDGCNGTQIRDVTYGEIHLCGEMTSKRGGAVLSGNALVLDDDLVGRYCAWKVKRAASSSRKTVTGRAGGIVRRKQYGHTPMEIDRE